MENGGEEGGVRVASDGCKQSGRADAVTLEMLQYCTWQLLERSALGAMAEEGDQLVRGWRASDRFLKAGGVEDRAHQVGEC